jgi:Mg2+/citrate symporter
VVCLGMVGCCRCLSAFSICLGVLQVKGMCAFSCGACRSTWTTEIIPRIMCEFSPHVTWLLGVNMNYVIELKQYMFLR